MIDKKFVRLTPQKQVSTGVVSSVDMMRVVGLSTLLLFAVSSLANAFGVNHVNAHDCHNHAQHAEQTHLDATLHSTTSLTPKQQTNHPEPKSIEMHEMESAGVLEIGDGIDPAEIRYLP